MGREQKGLSLYGKRIMSVTVVLSMSVDTELAGVISCHPLSDSCQTAVVFTAGRSESKYS